MMVGYDFLLLLKWNLERFFLIGSNKKPTEIERIIWTNKKQKNNSSHQWDWELIKLPMKSVQSLSNGGGHYTDIESCAKPFKKKKKKQATAPWKIIKCTLIKPKWNCEKMYAWKKWMKQTEIKNNESRMKESSSSSGNNNAVVVNWGGGGKLSSLRITPPQP